MGQLSISLIKLVVQLSVFLLELPDLSLALLLNSINLILILLLLLSHLVLEDVQFSLDLQ